MLLVDRTLLLKSAPCDITKGPILRVQRQATERVQLQATAIWCKLNRKYMDFSLEILERECLGVYLNYDKLENKKDLTEFYSKVKRSCLMCRLASFFT